MENNIILINEMIADLEMNIAECRKYDELIGETHELQVELFEAVATVKAMEEILESVEVSEEAIELSTTSEEVCELAEDMGDSIEDVEALREAMVAEEEVRLQEVDNEVDCRLRYAIRHAINFGKSATGKFKRGMTPNQVKQIVKLYDLINGFSMDEEQLAFIKTLNVKQGNYLIDTLMCYRRELA